jgi:hypothetical protein
MKRKLPLETDSAGGSIVFREQSPVLRDMEAEGKIQIARPDSFH